ncbi:hypothetical protein K432DRAFT_443663 [Lepidopterella palustris CBS 459.81]|uniref:Uncharacterized protein n=1 Tax=Lepidopterella palustris CBS 459.81 TaxID=1314670 RepID=A0A8E2JEN1_9PEZI|nr:hypothetical protein K432DRAFT_443663 [Lepidopterella palustris CBS 459.81]
MQWKILQDLEPQRKGIELLRAARSLTQHVAADISVAKSTEGSVVLEIRFYIALRKVIADVASPDMILSKTLQIDASVAWIEAPGAPQPIPYREGGWALCSRCAVNSQSEVVSPLLGVSSASDNIILAPKDVNPNAINSTSEVEEAAVPTIKVDDDSDVSINVITFKGSDDLNEEDDRDSQKDEREEQYS